MLQGQIMAAQGVNASALRKMLEDNLSRLSRGFAPLPVGMPPGMNSHPALLLASLSAQNAEQLFVLKKAGGRSVNKQEPSENPKVTRR
jgi:hypothetical protein